MLKPFRIPPYINYIGVFLTLRCNFGCPYCINKHTPLSLIPAELGVEDWIKGLSRIETRPDLPLTLQGGEPTLYGGWTQLANALKQDHDIPLDLLTNGSFNFPHFLSYINPTIFNRGAKYASIRFSFHPTIHDVSALAIKVNLLHELGYEVGIWGLKHFSFIIPNMRMGKLCREYGIDFRMKDFLGVWKGKFYGKMKYKGACNGKRQRNVECRTSEILFGPNGDIFRCHSDLYANRNPIAHVLDQEIKGIGEWRVCSHYGECNPCDIKIKTNRLQEYGHTSVKIKEVS